MARLTSEIALTADRNAQRIIDERTALVAIRCTCFDCKHNIRYKGHCNLKQIHIGENGGCEMAESGQYTEIEEN